MIFYRVDRRTSETREQIELPDFATARRQVNDIWDKGGYFALEERHYENGVKSMTIKDRSNKIIYQLKTML